jgi:ATP adenylyltransferase/5',5'''-P-1,P-4-tetraphosphate phosphorylase II
MAAQLMWQNITDAFVRARRSEAAKPTDSAVELLDCNNIQYVLRILHNLAEKRATKPKLDGASSQPPKDFRNPFLP